jgi:8-oxo-dGTP diphosphatase
MSDASVSAINNPVAHFAGKSAPHYHAGEISLLNSVDCVIFGFFGTELHVLLHKFPYEPFKGYWALLGGLCISSKALTMLLAILWND